MPSCRYACRASRRTRASISCCTRSAVTACRPAPEGEARDQRRRELHRARHRCAARGRVRSFEWLGSLPKGELESDLESAAFTVTGLDAARVQLHHTRRDREAYPLAAVRVVAALIGAEERLEDLRELFGRDPGPAIEHSNHGGIGAG